MVVIIDYGMGNLRSIQNKLERLGIKAEISADPKKIEKAKKLILPGVGSFAAGMTNLREKGLIGILNKQVIKKKIPILGICLGMQLFTNYSEEGNSKGLGWIDAETKKFNFSDKKLRIPHVGWNSIKIKNNLDIFNKIPKEHKFYFVHSYHVCCKNKEEVIATTNYGCDLHSVIRKGNILGVQFHPEKSHKDGIKLTKNFVERF